MYLNTGDWLIILISIIIYIHSYISIQKNINLNQLIKNCHSLSFNTCIYIYIKRFHWPPIEICVYSPRKYPFILCAPVKCTSSMCNDKFHLLLPYKVVPFSGPSISHNALLPVGNSLLFLREPIFFIFFPLGLILKEYVYNRERATETADKCILKFSASHLKIEMNIVCNLKVFKLFIVKVKLLLKYDKLNCLK